MINHDVQSLQTLRRATQHPPPSGDFYQVSLHPPASDTRRSIPRSALHFLCCSRRIDLIDLNVLLLDALHPNVATQHNAPHAVIIITTLHIVIMYHRNEFIT